MSCAVKLTLQRGQASPWGLRLQGGADFEKALVISHVTEGTPSHVSGLRVRCYIVISRYSLLTFSKVEIFENVL